jgi:methylated-DNA-[protein]-cysteine S-methyltransferase
MGNDRHSAATELGGMTARDSDPPNSLAMVASRPDVDECDVCCEAMPGYVCGDLKAIDAKWLEEHTEHCGYCRRELSGFQRLDHLLAAYESRCCEAVLAPPPFTQRTREVARYGEMESPIGPLLIAVTDDGVCEIEFGRSTTVAAFLGRLTGRGFDPVADQRAIAPVVKQLSEYFQGRRNTFDVPVDFSGLSPFARDVLQATARVPFGGVATYSEIAKRIGNPGASRAVGNALGRNPIPVILPCHRVVPADHSIGKYTGGVDIKVKLLSLEGAALPAGALVS